MLEFNQGKTQQEILSRISAIRNSQESEEKSDTPEESEGQMSASDEETQEAANTDEEEVENISDDDQEALEASEDEESEQQEELEATEDDEEEIEYYLIDGEEVPLSEVEKWKKGHMMQSDYTRKTQALAEQRKALEADQESLSELQKQLNDKLARLDSIIDESDVIDWEELREYDPSEYLEKKEKLDKLKAERAEAKKLKGEEPQYSEEELIEGQRRIFAANPDFVDNKGQITSAYKERLGDLEKLLIKLGIDVQKASKNIDPDFWLVALEAAKGSKSSISAAKTKKVKKAPIVTKPKSKSGQSQLDKQIAEAQAKLKQTGSERDAFHLMKLKKQKRGR